MALTSRLYPCFGKIISSPNTRTWLRNSRSLEMVTLSRGSRLAPRAMQSITKLITGNVVAVPCEANFRSDRKLLCWEIPSQTYLVRAACRAVSKGGLVLSIRSTVQHDNRSLASDKSTVARFRSREACRTNEPDLFWSLKSIIPPTTGWKRD